ncbi:hypothetical protein SLEP1_g16741 [Rubroshorea leprosula]|uniref:Uncharacterized protein n=1 Tax=Rubroshorea leprosula TaxID=152421 RepID=A0AAV5J3H0_9ROSI|nr:hypothetical protein SLEP1_g16741 [Rubroshorea leprosula]
MIVPPALQDLPETMTPESSTRDNGGDHHSSSSSSSSSEETPSREEGTGNVVSNVSDLPVIGEWESRTITGRLSNLRKVPKDLPTGFRFKVALHHEVADNAPSISGYRKLEEMVKAYHISRTILLWTNAELRVGSDVVNAQQYKVHHRLYAVVCEVGGAGEGDSVQVAVPMPKRQFIFVRDTRTERISNDLAARLSEWRVPNAHVNYPQLLPRDTNLKNQLLEHARRENLIDLDALVTSEQLAVFGFVDVANLFTKVSPGFPRRAAGSAQQRQTRFDKWPPPTPQSRCSSHRGSSSASRPRADQRAETAAPSVRRLRARRWTVKMSHSGACIYVGLSVGAQDRVSGRLQLREAGCQPTMVQGMQSFVPPMDRQRARTFVQQHGGQVAMVKLMDRSAMRWRCLRASRGLALKITSSAPTVNGWPQKRPALWMMSIVCKVRRWPIELLQRRAEQTSSLVGIISSWRNWSEPALKEKAESSDKGRGHLVAEADRNLNAAEEALNELKTSHGRYVSIARAQGVLQHRPDFPIRELAFFNGEDLDEQGNSLSPLADATVRLRWDLNEEGVPVWPPSILEEGEDPAGLPTFDSWVEGAPVAEHEPSSTPPNSQPAMVPTRSPIVAPAPEPAIRSPPARSSPPTAADASMPVDLTDD